MTTLVARIFNSYYLSTLLLLNACHKKEETTSASGRVLQFGTNIPIEGATVYLQKCSGDADFGNGSFSCETVDTVITPQDGTYAFPDISTDGFFMITGEKDQYYEYLSNIAIRERQHNTNDIILTPYAWLKLHIKNVNPVDMLDKVQVASELGLSWTEFSGTDINEKITFLSKGNTEGHIRWDVLKGGVETINRDTVIISAHDTLLYELFY